MPDYPNLPPTGDYEWAWWSIEDDATCGNCGAPIPGNRRNRSGDPIAKTRDGQYLCERCFTW